MFKSNHMHSLTITHIPSLGFQSAQGCPDCVHENPSHISRMMYLGGTRRHLSPDSPLRQRRCGVYQFINAELRPPAVRRTTQLMKECLQIAKDNNLQHVCGFTGQPMLSLRIGFDYILDNIAEWMHALARVFVFFVAIIFGSHGGSSRAANWASRCMDSKHRIECERLDIFPIVWPNRRIKLTDDQRAALLQPSDADVAGTTRPELERWAHSIGEKTSDLSMDELRAKVMNIRRRLRQPEDYFFVPTSPAQLPWRLSRTAFDQVDRRVLRMVFPHNTESLVKDGRTFLQYSNASNKTSKKLLALLVVLPTVLRGHVQALRRGLRLVVLGLRMLEGQVHSYNECIRLGVEPGSRTFDNRLIPKIRRLIVTGLAMVTGSVPPSSLIPCLHLLSHYAEHAALFGILKWYWMMCFERYNRFVKEMCYNNNWPFASIANTYLRRAAHHYEHIKSCLGPPKCTCRLLGKDHFWKGPPDEVVAFLFGMSIDLGLDSRCRIRIWLFTYYINNYNNMYMHVSLLIVRNIYRSFITIVGKCRCCSMQKLRGSLVYHSKANICGVEFTAGQSLSGNGRGRCGSLMTCVMNGKSVYGRIVKFFKRVCDSDSNSLFAYIQWCRIPEYPMKGTPLIVKVRDNASACLVPPVVSIFDIDPSRVINERDDDEGCYYMCRIEGLDKIN